MIKWGRLLTAMVTPFKAVSGEPIDWEAVERIVTHLIATGSDGLVVRGTTGESPTLTHAEDYELYRRVKDQVRGRIPVIAGTGSNCTRTAIAATQEAEKIGVDAAMVVVPYYNKPSQAGLLAHFKALARCTGLPLILYNIPGRTGINLLPETVAELAQISNIIGLKEASGDLRQVAKIKSLVPSSFLIYSGDDLLTLEFIRLGCHGVISVASHLAGRSMQQLILAGRESSPMADEIQARLTPLFKNLFCTSNPVPVKVALHRLGLCAPTVRLPLVGANLNEIKQVHDAMEAAGVLSAALT